MNSAIGAVKKAVGYYFRIFDPGKNGLRSTDDLSLKLKYEFVLGDPNNSFLYISIWDDDKEKSVEMCLHEVDPLRNANGKNKVITIADTRYIQRWFERKVDPMLCKGDLYFFSNCLATAKHQRPRTHERTPGIPPNLDDLEVNDFADVLGTIAEDLHLTRCAQVCFAGTEEDQAEQGDHGTIDEVLGDPRLWNKEKIPWKKLIEMLIYLNRYLFLITQSPRKKVQYHGFVFFAVLALRSSDYIETCDI